MKRREGTVGLVGYLYRRLSSVVNQLLWTNKTFLQFTSNFGPHPKPRRHKFSIHQLILQMYSIIWSKRGTIADGFESLVRASITAYNVLLVLALALSRGAFTWNTRLRVTDQSFHSLFINLHPTPSPPPHPRLFVQSQVTPSRSRT